MQKQRHTDTALDELLTHKELNSWLYFDDLWNAVTYTRVGTVWTPLLPKDWYKPAQEIRRYRAGSRTDPDAVPGTMARQGYGHSALTVA